MKLLKKAFHSDPALALGMVARGATSLHSWIAWPDDRLAAAPNLRAVFHWAGETDAQLEVSLRTKAIFGR